MEHASEGESCRVYANAGGGDYELTGQYNRGKFTGWEM